MNRVGFAILMITFSWAPCSGFFDLWWSDLLICLFPLAALTALVFEHWHDPASIRIPVGSNALLGLIIFGLLQLVPIPPQLMRLLSPNAWAIYQKTVGVLQSDPWMPLTLATKTSLGTVFFLTGCWAAYVVSANMLADRKKLKIAVGFLAAFAGGLAASILALWALNALFAILPSQNGTQLAFSLRHSSMMTTFMVMICPLSLALFLTERPTVRYGPLKERLSEFLVNFGQRRYLIYGLPAIAIPLAMATYWPEGLLILLFAVLLMLIFLGLRSRGRRESPYLFVYLFMILILSISLPVTNSARPDPGKIAAIEEKTVAGGTIPRQVVSDFALTGAGYGSFSAVSKRYRHPLANNTFGGASVQRIFRLASQSGLIGFCLAGWFLFVFFRHTIRSWLQRRQKFSVYLYAAGMGSFFAFVLSFFSTGGLGFGGFSVLVFMLLGLLAATTEPSTQISPSKKIHRVGWILMGIVGIVGMISSAYFYIGDQVGEKLYSAARNSISETAEAYKTSQNLIALASFFDPFNPRYCYVKGYQAAELQDDDRALEHFSKGMRLDPLDGKSLYALGKYFFTIGNKVTAEKLVLAAVASDPLSREFQTEYIEQLLNAQQLTKALVVIRDFLKSSPDDTLFWIQQVANYGFDDSQRIKILPELSRSYHDYGLYLLQHGDIAKADELFRKTLALARQEEQPDQLIFLPMVRFFEKRQRYDDALDTLMVASAKYPQDVNFLLAKGRIYQEMGITFKAREIYQKVLILNPANEEARHNLDILQGLF